MLVFVLVFAHGGRPGPGAAATARALEPRAGVARRGGRAARRPAGRQVSLSCSSQLVASLPSLVWKALFVLAAEFLSE